MSSQTTSSLEQRITSALSADANINSSVIADLIEETTAEITIAEAVAADEKQRALDPSLSPDPKAARQRMENAAFEVDRLKTLLPRLERRAEQVRAQEEREIYEAKRDELQAEADRIEDELIEIYSDCAQRIRKTFSRAAAFSERLRRELPSLPTNVEAFRPFDRAVDCLLTDVVLVDLDDRQIWPPRSLRHGNPNGLAVLSAQQPTPYHPGAEWWRPEFQKEGRDRERAQIAQSYERASKEQEERQNREERERFAVSNRATSSGA